MIWTLTHISGVRSLRLLPLYPGRALDFLQLFNILALHESFQCKLTCPDISMMWTVGLQLRTDFNLLLMNLLSGELVVACYGIPLDFYAAARWVRPVQFLSLSHCPGEAGTWATGCVRPQASSSPSSAWPASTTWSPSPSSDISSYASPTWGVTQHSQRVEKCYFRITSVCTAGRWCTASYWPPGPTASSWPCRHSWAGASTSSRTTGWAAPPLGRTATTRDTTWASSYSASSSLSEWSSWRELGSCSSSASTSLPCNHNLENLQRRRRKSCPWWWETDFYHLLAIFISRSWWWSVCSSSAGVHMLLRVWPELWTMYVSNVSPPYSSIQRTVFTLGSSTSADGLPTPVCQVGSPGQPPHLRPHE